MKKLYIFALLVVAIPMQQQAINLSEVSNHIVDGTLWTAKNVAVPVAISVTSTVLTKIILDTRNTKNIEEKLIEEQRFVYAYGNTINNKILGELLKDDITFQYTLHRLEVEEANIRSSSRSTQEKSILLQRNYTQQIQTLESLFPWIQEHCKNEQAKEAFEDSLKKQINFLYENIKQIDSTVIS